MGLGFLQGEGPAGWPGPLLLILRNIPDCCPSHLSSPEGA